MINIIIGGILAVIAFFALRNVIRSKKNGKCGNCNCSCCDKCRGQQK